MPHSLHSLFRDVFDGNDAVAVRYSNGGSSSAHSMHSMARAVYDPTTSSIRVLAPGGSDSSSISLIALTQSEGDLHLSDATNWGYSKSLIKYIRVVTSSTDWDLHLLQNDNGYAADDATFPVLQIMDGGRGNLTLYIDYIYEDEDATDEVHLYWIDQSGSATADFYIVGQGLV